MLKINRTPQQHERTDEDGKPDETGEWCELCGTIDSEGCFELCEALACTRPKHHTGPHAACGIFKSQHPMIEWEIIDPDPQQQESD